MTQNSKLSKIHTLPSATLKSHLYVLYNTHARIHSKTIRQEKQRQRERVQPVKKSKVSKWGLWVCLAFWSSLDAMDYGECTLTFSLKGLLRFQRERSGGGKGGLHSSQFNLCCVCFPLVCFCVSGVTNTVTCLMIKKPMLIHNKNSIFNIDIKNKNTRTEDSKVKKQN